MPEKKRSFMLTLFSMLFCAALAPLAKLLERIVPKEKPEETWDNAMWG